MKPEKDFHDDIESQEEKSSKRWRNPKPDEATADRLMNQKYKTDYPTSPETRKDNMIERIVRLRGRKED